MDVYISVATEQGGNDIIQGNPTTSIASIWGYDCATGKHAIGAPRACRAHEEGDAHRSIHPGSRTMNMGRGNIIDIGCN
jgi:hypothetical protein